MTIESAPKGPFAIDRVLTVLERAVKGMEVPVVSAEADSHGDPFRVLVATIISLRTKDETTLAASLRLFARADTPQTMSQMDEREIAALIHPAGFFRVKARQLRALSQRLLDQFDGRVPDDIDTLVTFDGVGRKTANLVLTAGYKRPAICVDIHVHRICNRWGYIRTKTPDATEMRLRKKLPARWWIPINAILVAFGRNICRPVSPFCSRCPVAAHCRQVGVTVRR